MEFLTIPVEHCSCGDCGFNIIPDSDGDPEQEQCEFCYTVPWSAFNLNSILDAYNNKYKKTEIIIELMPF